MNTIVKYSHSLYILWGNIMTVSMIYDKLIKTEYIVFENNGGFSAPNNSIIGSKKLYITNHGRVLGYDSGGIFSSEQSWEYKKKIKVQISESDVLLSNHKKILLHFIFLSLIGSFTTYINR